MRNFGIPEPHKPRIDPSEFDDPFFGGEKKLPKPNVYLELGDERREKVETQEAPKTQHGELGPEEQAEILIDLVARLLSDSEIELTQQEASLVYQVEADLPFFDEDPKTDISHNDLADYVKAKRGYYDNAEIRQLRDYEQVKSLIIERLRSEKNVIETSTALLQVAEGLGLDPVEYNPNLYMQTLKEKMKDWEERGVFDYLTLELIKNNNRHNIVPVPNDPELGEDELVALAKKFGEEQPFETYIDDEYEESMYGQHHFTLEPSILTGYNEQAGPIRLSLVPSKFSSELGAKPVAEQLTILTQMQATSPVLNYHIPSQLDAVAHWYILRAQGDKLNDVASFAKTYIRNIDVEPIVLDGDSQVPASSVSIDGKPALNKNFASYLNHGRVSMR